MPGCIYVHVCVCVSLSLSLSLSLSIYIYIYIYKSTYDNYRSFQFHISLRLWGLSFVHRWWYFLAFVTLKTSCSCLGHVLFVETAWCGSFTFSPPFACRLLAPLSLFLKDQSGGGDPWFPHPQISSDDVLYYGGEWYLRVESSSLNCCLYPSGRALSTLAPRG